MTQTIVKLKEREPRAGEGSMIKDSNVQRLKGIQEWSAQSTGEKVSIDERNEEFLPLANYLCEIIQTKKDISYNLRQIKQWSNEIRMLSEQNHIPPTRIKKALRWYKKNIGGQYIPVIESALG